MKRSTVASILVAVVLLALGVIAEAQQPKKVPAHWSGAHAGGSVDVWHAFNHIWSVAGWKSRPSLSNTFLQPFLSYTTPTACSFTLETESTYDWEGKQWAVPVHAIASKVLKIGDQRVSIGGGVRYWGDGPDTRWPKYRDLKRRLMSRCVSCRSLAIGPRRGGNFCERDHEQFGRPGRKMGGEPASWSTEPPAF